ncbi:MAG: LamG domain-containing protein [Candidatus Poribacteria bacterium]|nr:LamG domain-containing protein [Candidatus Poribacteria bacterium]
MRIVTRSTILRWGFGLFLIAAVVFVERVSAQTAILAAWQFDEGSGNTASDGSGGGFDGEITGAKWVNGKFGGALEFNGDGDNVFIPFDEKQNLDTVTIAAWVYPERWNPDLNAIAQKWEDGTNKRQYQITIYQQKAWWYTSTTGGDFPRTDLAAAVINTNEWVHLVGTYDGATMRVYVNGVLDEEKVQAAGLFKSDIGMQIGGYGPNSPVKYNQNRHFAGVIDEVYVFSDAITASEVRDLMAGPLRAVEPKGKLPTIWSELKSQR